MSKIIAYIAANQPAMIIIAAIALVVIFRFAAPKAYEKFDDVVSAIIKYFCVFLLAAMIAICFGNTVSRYAFGYSPRWAEETIRYCAVWVTCVGASITARADNHTTMDLLQELIKNHKARAVAYAMTRFIACLFLILLIPAAVKMLSIYSHSFSNAIVINGKKLPQNVLYYSYLVGSISMIFGYLRIVPPKVKKIWTNTMEKTEFELIQEGVIE